ncbi:hypothetical protein F5X68DRAFT_178495 [Plectosphaerella plurivora]|uniref:Xylanolytic transcriptional activator regulatory domain-containing protein n=1 Tax=Plectosphaerella plurivora TaxID=936078 RepID=A0A9P8V0I8_9PEZI|nr:hypothetical protein F5X68DRAFT_178495 [Plectosphaerella plurivora]
MLSPPESNESTSRRRVVRKGTRSCWECAAGRRRKVKCRFNNPKDATCINCVDRETSCLSQRYTENVSADSQHGHPSPPEDARPRASPSASSAGRAPEAFYPTVSTRDLLDNSAATHAHEIAVVANGSVAEDEIMPREQSVMPVDPSLSEEAVNHPYLVAHNKSTREHRAQLSRHLHSLLPPPQLRSLLAHDSPGVTWALSFSHTRDDKIAGRVEPQWSLASASWPSPNSHPVIIARRLMQYAICMQSLPPNFDISRFKLPHDDPACEYVGKWVGAVSSLVVNDDELVSCAEGIETLTLLGMFQADSGHLRRAWMTHRRALSFCHLMGVDGKSSTRRPVRSCAGSSDPRAPPSMAVLWRRLNCADRYHSIILGLPIASQSDAFSRASTLPWETPLDQLEAEHAVICKRIAERNELPLRSSDARSMTQSIDYQMRCISDKMEPSWWKIPDFSLGLTEVTSFAPKTHFLARTITKLQVQHYILLLLLHLPQLLQNHDTQQHEASRKACKNASTAVLNRFLAFRTSSRMIMAGRPIDYATLIAGMTLPMTYLERVLGDASEMAADRDLLERVILIFRDMSSYKQDRLSIESADTMHQLLPIMRGSTGQGGQEPVRLKVPFLGTVVIKHTTPEKASNQGAISPFGLSSESGGFGVHQQMSIALEPDQFGLQTPDTSDSLFGLGEGEQVLFPPSNLSADPESWVFQGIDMVYWSMLDQSMNDMPEPESQTFDFTI